MKKNNSKIFGGQAKAGSAAIISLLIFLGISTSVLFAFSEPLIQGAYIAGASYNSKESYYTAEALTEDIVYRLNNSMDVDASESLIVGGYSASASITDVGGNKEITVTGDSDGFERTIKANISTAEGVSFSYGVQVGNGGFVMSNNSTVIGNVYSNGNITGSNGASITGSAVAADSTPLASDQSNTAPVVPTQSINFRNVSASQDFSQSFQVSTSSKINKVQVFIKKTGSPSNATIRIVNNNSGSPGTTNTVTGTLNASLITTSYGWIDVVFATNPTLTAGTTYWLVIDNSTQSASNYFTIGANSAYTSGQAKVGTYAGTWNNTSPSGLDGYFNIYLGGTASSISGVAVGTSGTDLAWANTVSNVTVTGPLYCLVGSSNNKACDSSRPNPSTQPFPISDANIADWKNDGTDGGVITGNFTATTSTSLGPKKITGNLTVSNGVTLNMTGALYVQGNISVSNNAKIKLDASYGANSGVLISDGKITISNNGTFAGSGQASSYMLVITTSNCPTGGSCGGGNAIEVANNAGTVILNAQNGTLHISNNAGANAATAKTISLDNGATVTYQTGLQNVNFSSGPSGSWAINSWREVE